jgi:hypothetical protein
LKPIINYKILVFSLLFSFLAITGGEFFHHHTDSNFDENNCPVCLILHSLSSVDINIDSGVIHPETFEIISIQESFNKPDLKYTSVLSDRAPPFNS